MDTTRSTRRRSGALALGVAALLAACGPAEPNAAAPPQPADAGGRAAPPPRAGADAATDRAPLDLSAADLANGRRQWALCATCHTLAPGQHRVGPSLAGVFDRAAGSAVDFPYSPALAAAEFAWTPDALDAYLADSLGFLPGNRMVFLLLADKPDDRRDLIAWLVAETGRP